MHMHSVGLCSGVSIVVVLIELVCVLLMLSYVARKRACGLVV